MRFIIIQYPIILIRKVFSDYIENLSEGSFYNQLSIQIFLLPTICEKKYAYVEKALKFFILGIACFILLLILLYFNISFDLLSLIN